MTKPACMCDEHTPFGNHSQNPVTQIVPALGNGQCTGIVVNYRKWGRHGKRIAKRYRTVVLSLLRCQQECSHTVVFAAKMGYGIPGSIQNNSADFGGIPVRLHGFKGDDLRRSRDQMSAFGNWISNETVRGSGKNVRLYTVPFPSFRRVSA